MGAYAVRLEVAPFPVEIGVWPPASPARLGKAGSSLRSGMTRFLVERREFPKWEVWEIYLLLGIAFGEVGVTLFLWW